MRIVYSLSELEMLLAEESKRRIGYDEKKVAVIKATSGRAMSEDDAEGTSSPVIIIDVALPEEEAGAIVPDLQIEEVSGGTARGSKKRGAKKGSSKKK